jgi:hypothetical protein
MARSRVLASVPAPLDQQGRAAGIGEAVAVDLDVGSGQVLAVSNPGSAP